MSHEYCLAIGRQYINSLVDSFLLSKCSVDQIIVGLDLKYTIKLIGWRIIIFEKNNARELPVNNAYVSTTTTHKKRKPTE